MPRYVRVLTKVWQDEVFVGLDPDARLLFLYLLTSPHQNILGMYVLPAGYACADLGWEDRRRFDAAMESLQPKLVRYDHRTRVVWVRNFLLHNPLSNDSQVKAAAAQVDELPHSGLLRELAEYLEQMPRPSDSKVSFEELVAKCRAWAGPAISMTPAESAESLEPEEEGPSGQQDDEGAGTVKAPCGHGAGAETPPSPDAALDASSEGFTPASGGSGIAPSRRRGEHEQDRPLQPQTLAAQGNGTVEPPCGHGAATVPAPSEHTVSVTVSVSGSNSVDRDSSTADETSCRVDTHAPPPDFCPPDGGHACEAPEAEGAAAESSPAPDAGGGEEPKAAGKSKRAKANAYTDDFEQFWAVYPRRVEKAAAFGCWKARMREGIKPGQLVEAASNYAAYCRERGTEQEYIKHPKTFLSKNKPFLDWLRPRAAPVAQERVPQSWHTLRRYLERVEGGDGGDQGGNGETAGALGVVLSGLGSPVGGDH